MHVPVVLHQRSMGLRRARPNTTIHNPIATTTPTPMATCFNESEGAPGGAGGGGGGGVGRAVAIESGFTASPGGDGRPATNISFKSAFN